MALPISHHFEVRPAAKIADFKPHLSALRLKPLPLPAYLHRLNGNSIKSISAPRNSLDSKNTKDECV